MVIHGRVKLVYLQVCQSIRLVTGIRPKIVRIPFEIGWLVAIGTLVGTHRIVVTQAA